MSTTLLNHYVAVRQSLPGAALGTLVDDRAESSAVVADPCP